MDLTHLPLDVARLSLRYCSRELRTHDLISELLRRLDRCPDPTVWIHRLDRQTLFAQADALEARHASGERLPLYGIPFAVKDNLDVAGLPTTAACPAFRYVPSASSPVVAQLQAAGALLVGKTNLDQFASGLAGDRTPHGACRNPFHGDYICGGSSSGSAAAVARGLVSFALGTDTAGSGRVPAGCTNLVGLKPTPGLLSTQGLVPSCRSLDCVSILALTVQDARLVFEVAQQRRWPEDPLPTPERIFPDCPRRFAFATPRDEDLEFFGDAGQAGVFTEALVQLKEMGGRRCPVDFRPFRETAALLYEGPWLAERYTALEAFLKEHAAEVYPVSAKLLQGGTAYRAADVFQGLHRLAALRKTCLAALEEVDLLVVPTLPALPTLTEVQSDSPGWSRRLGYYTNFANLLGLAGVAVPAGFTPRGLPGGITLLGPAGSDRRLCDFATLWQQRRNLPLGATGHHLPEAGPISARPPAGPGPGLVRHRRGRRPSARPAAS